MLQPRRGCGVALHFALLGDRGKIRRSTAAGIGAWRELFSEAAADDGASKADKVWFQQLDQQPVFMGGSSTDTDHNHNHNPGYVLASAGGTENVGYILASAGGPDVADEADGDNADAMPGRIYSGVDDSQPMARLRMQLRHGDGDGDGAPHRAVSDV